MSAPHPLSSLGLWYPGCPCWPDQAEVDQIVAELNAALADAPRPVVVRNQFERDWFDTWGTAERVDYARRRFVSGRGED